MKYRKKPVVVDATQWFKNGDHPLDYSEDRTGFENDEFRTWSGEEAKALAWEGGVVVDGFFTHNCYGNHMPWAKRVDHTTDDFLPRLEQEIEDLLAVRGRAGILVRLHALGDFYSVDYVRFWRMLLMRHKRLAVYGYTARDVDSDIGWAIRGLVADFRERAMIRFSNAAWPLMATVPITRPEQCPPNAFVCPEQTGRTQACATCAACWGTPKNVAFIAH